MKRGSPLVSFRGSEAELSRIGRARGVLSHEQSLARGHTLLREIAYGNCFFFVVVVVAMMVDR